MKNYLSFGAGVNSVALYLLMQEMGIEFEAIFVNHGADWPETYAYVDYFVATGRPVTVLRPAYFRADTGKTYDNLFDYCWDYERTPSRVARWCTGKFKITPIEKYISTPCFSHLGIDAGEARRAKLNSKKGVESRWLLIKNNIDREGCKEMIAAAGLVVPPKSGCWFCPFQRTHEWKKLRRTHPDLFCKAQKLEQRNMAYRVSIGKAPFTIRANGKTLDKIINEKQAALPGMEELNFPPCQCGL
jgi:3'-phosphoadenosine 5'-phosphosulfate sulfotransferase (PAPS reductase)/FAD synthetase